MPYTEPTIGGDEVPRAVKADEVAELLTAFVHALAAETAVRDVLARCGISAAAARPVATLDDLGRPMVRLSLTAADEARFVAMVDALRAAPAAMPRQVR